jgi:hypothetical protein
MSATERRDHIRAMLADLRLPGALEAVDEILGEVDRGSLNASEAMEHLLSAQITLRNNHRLRTAMRSSRLPGGWRQLDLPVVVVGRSGRSGADDN